MPGSRGSTVEKASSLLSRNLRSRTGVLNSPELDAKICGLFAFGKEEARKGGRAQLCVSFSKESDPPKNKKGDCQS